MNEIDLQEKSGRFIWKPKIKERVIEIASFFLFIHLRYISFLDFWSSSNPVGFRRIWANFKFWILNSEFRAIYLIQARNHEIQPHIKSSPNSWTQFKDSGRLDIKHKSLFGPAMKKSHLDKDRYIVLVVSTTKPRLKSLASKLLFGSLLSWFTIGHLRSR